MYTVWFQKYPHPTQGGSLLVKDATKKHQHEQNQQKIASENKEKPKKKMARERSKEYHQKKKDRNGQVQAEAAPIEVTSMPFPNRMAKKRAIG